MMKRRLLFHNACGPSLTRGVPIFSHGCSGAEMQTDSHPLRGHSRHSIDRFAFAAAQFRAN
jgi:hypothetical protein